MSKDQCFERAEQTNGDGSCAFLSFAPSFNNGQTGCFCFNAVDCHALKSRPDGQDGDWTTYRMSASSASTAPSTTVAESTAAVTSMAPEPSSTDGVLTTES